jgi:hypothetical protein
MTNKLITDVNEAQAELSVDLSSAASKEEVARYVNGYVQDQLKPIITQQVLTANVINLFLDYLEQKGLMLVAVPDGRARLSAVEFKAFVDDVAAASKERKK